MVTMGTADACIRDKVLHFFNQCVLSVIADNQNIARYRPRQSVYPPVLNKKSFNQTVCGLNSFSRDAMCETGLQPQLQATNLGTK